MEKGIEHIYGNPTYSGGHFLPPADNSYDLGSATMAWRNIYVDTLIYVTGTVMQGDFLPSVTGTYDIGSTTYEWQDLWITGIAYIDTLYMEVAGRVNDDILLQFGTTGDGVLVLNTAGLAADTALTNVVEGTARRMATAANSLLISNVTNDGDMQFLVSDGGNSWGMLTFNADDHSAHFGQNDYGVDVLFYGATGSCFWEWDESEDRVDQAAVFGNSTGNESAYVLTITDSSTASSDMHRGIVVDLTGSGAKTGTAHLECFSADVTLTANTPQTAIYGAWITQSGAPVLGYVIGMDIYFEDLGANVGNLMGMQITVDGTNVAGARHTPLRLTTVGAGNTKAGLLMDVLAVYGLDMGGSTLSTADIRFQGGTTLTDDGADLTLAGANLVLGSGLTLGGTVTGANQTVNNLGTIGLFNTAASANYGIYLSKVQTVTDNGTYGGLIFLRELAKTASGFSGTLRGVYSNMKVGGANTQNWTAATGLRGFSSFLESLASSSGTITGMVSFWADADITDAATITNLYGVYINTPTVAGSKLTNEYGIYIADQNTGLTLNYAIYTNAGLVHFGGAIDTDADISFDTSIDSAAVADTVSLGCYEISGGHRALALSCEEAVLTEAVGASDRTLPVRINGATLKLMLHT